jgi:multidrug efflux system membrane fusion protein
VVKLGPAEGNRVSVTEGLREGELVVVDGTDRLRPGGAVEVTSARPEIKPPAEGARKGRGKGERKKAE